MNLRIEEIAHSIELYNTAKQLQRSAQNGVHEIALTKEPPRREREEVSSVVVACGSYDPLTVAHVALFENGIETAQRIPHEGKSELLILTSTQHAHKRVDLRKNSSLADRVHSLEGFAACHSGGRYGVSLGFMNMGLYIDVLPQIEKKYTNANVFFLMGTDVMEKLVLPKYYDNDESKMQEAIATLMQHYLIVGDRQVDNQFVTLDDIAKANPFLGPYVDDNRLLRMEMKNQFKHLAIGLKSVSSSAIRKLRSQSEAVQARQLEAIGISEFVENREIYLDTNAYEAFVCVRHMFADHHGPSMPPGMYMHDLLNSIQALTDSGYRTEVINAYRCGAFHPAKHL